MEEGKVLWHKDKCVQCDTCLKTCPNNSSPKISLMSIEDCIAEIKKVQPFIRGITCSGGECMNHADFMLELFKEAKKMGLGCLIDSNGVVEYASYPELMEVADGVMLDMKAFDPEFHKQLTHQSNDIVIKNLKWLLDHDLLQEVRTVLLPNFPKQNENTVREVAKILNHRSYYKIIKYRPFGVTDQGIEFCGQSILSDEEAERCLEIARQYTNNAGLV